MLGFAAAGAMIAVRESIAVVTTTVFNIFGFLPGLLVIISPGTNLKVFHINSFDGETEVRVRQHRESERGAWRGRRPTTTESTTASAKGAFCDGSRRDILATKQLMNL